MTILAHKWRRFSELGGYRRGAIMEAATGLTVGWVGLRLVGFRRWKAALEWLVPRSPHQDFGGRAGETVDLLAQSESSAARNLPFRTNCLERSLVLWWLLRRRGIDAELRIGARKDAPNFEAHAWVECNGRVINEPGETHLHFTPFDGPIASAETHRR
jgi:Transglutaminase-like superfamily